MNNSILIVMIAMVMNKINKTGTVVKRMIFCPGSIDVGLEVLDGATVTLLVLFIVVVVMITAVE